MECLGSPRPSFLRRLAAVDCVPPFTSVREVFEIGTGLAGAGQLGRARLSGRLHLFLVCHATTFPAAICLPPALQGKRDLNPQPSVLETDALPIELLPSGAPSPAASVAEHAVTWAHKNSGDEPPNHRVY